jgi:glycosyltransferase involved in cell wall biosynthesis
MTASPSRKVYRRLTRRAEMAADVFVTYIIPTIGRASLAVSVKSVLTQNFHRAPVEVVVVNDSGIPLQEEDWQANPRVSMINTNRCERSYARNSGAAIAKGKYLAFLDDDDWILPGALEDFWQLSQRRPQAAWLYGGIQIVNEHGLVLREINSELNGNCFSQIMGGAWAPIQASIIRADAFFATGGYNPLISAIEDEDLCRRIAFAWEFANTTTAVAVLFRGQTWKTSTNYLHAPINTKYSRELILRHPGAFRRLHTSADSSYWHGRNLRVYLSTVAWNMKHKRLFTAASRLFASLAAFGLSIPHAFSPVYWKGVKADHVPETLHFVMKEYEHEAREKKKLSMKP